MMIKHVQKSGFFLYRGKYSYYLKNILNICGIERRNKNVIFNYWNCCRNYFRNVLNGDIQKMNCKDNSY